MSSVELLYLTALQLFILVSESIWRSVQILTTEVSLFNREAQKWVTEFYS